MSKQIGLPVYKATYDLFIFSFKIIKDMEKDYKYTVGEKLKNEIMDLLKFGVKSCISTFYIFKKMLEARIWRLERNCN